MVKLVGQHDFTGFTASGSSVNDGSNHISDLFIQKTISTKYKFEIFFIKLNNFCLINGSHLVIN
ncbi:hypothetical protein PSY23_23360, partial [Shigella flexneri]|nr:hypothetical protein [Shigella flexneri]